MFAVPEHHAVELDPSGVGVADSPGHEGHAGSRVPVPPHLVTVHCQLEHLLRTNQYSSSSSADQPTKVLTPSVAESEAASQARLQEVLVPEIGKRHWEAATCSSLPR